MNLKKFGIKNLWNDSLKAQSFLKDLKSKKDKLDQFKFLENKSNEIVELCEISVDLDDDSEFKQSILT